MITRQVRYQLVVFGLVAILGLVYAGGRYAGLGKLVPGYDKGFLVSAQFQDSGGIFEGAEVTYRGVSVGKVEKLQLIKAGSVAGLPSGGVTVQLRLKPGTKVSATMTKAIVGNRSAVGEQYVDLQPCSYTNAANPQAAVGDAEACGKTEKPLLKDRDVIRPAMTGIPIAPVQLITNLNSVVTSVNTADVTTVLNELGTAFDGAGDDLQRLIDASNALTTTATQYLPQTVKLIQDSKPVLDTQRQVADEFKSYNADLAQLSAQLRSSDPDFRSLFTKGTDSARTVTSLLEANRTNLPILLDNLVFTAQVQAVRIPAIRQILVTYPNVVAGGFTVTPGDGTAHFGFVTDQGSPVCPGDDPGYRTPERDPSDVSVKPANLNAYCSTGSGTTNRGADKAPRAEGLKPFPADRSQPINQQTALYGGFTGTNGYSTGLADYDPSTGHVISSTGQTYTLSSTAGASSVFGSSSWEWLLMNPLRSS
jgi:phospholipid/cholesterol/gamma-HCH transport system substrate-binding protein